MYSLRCGGGSLVAKLCPNLATPWGVVCQAPLSMRIPRQEYWSGLPFPSPGGPTDPGIEPVSPALPADSLPTELWGKPSLRCKRYYDKCTISVCLGNKYILWLKEDSKEGWGHRQKLNLLFWLNYLWLWSLGWKHFPPYMLCLLLPGGLSTTSQEVNSKKK